MGTPFWMIFMSPARGSRNFSSTDIGLVAKDGQAHARNAPFAPARSNCQDDLARSRCESPPTRAKENGKDNHYSALFTMGQSSNGTRGKGSLADCSLRAARALCRQSRRGVLGRVARGPDRGRRHRRRREALADHCKDLLYGAKPRMVLDALALRCS